MSAPSPRAYPDGAEGDGRPAHDDECSAGESLNDDLSSPERVDVRAGARVVSDQALLRRAFGPQEAGLDPDEARMLATILRRRAGDAIARRTTTRSRPPAHVEHAVAGDSPPVSVRDAPVADEVSVAPPAKRGPASYRLLGQRFRAAALGAMVAVVTIGIGVLIWGASQPRPTVVLHGESLAAAEAERMLGSDLNKFQFFDVRTAVSYGEAYGARVIGVTLGSSTYDGEMECIWLLQPKRAGIPLCTGVPERADYPRLIDLWHDGEEFVWGVTPPGELRQVRICVQRNRLEMWEQKIEVTS